MSKNAQPYLGPLAGLRETLDQAEELVLDGLPAFAALRLGQLCTEAGEIGSALGAEALNSLGQPAADKSKVRLHVPQQGDSHLPHADTAAS